MCRGVVVLLHWEGFVVLVLVVVESEGKERKKGGNGKVNGGSGTNDAVLGGRRRGECGGTWTCERVGQLLR